MIQEWFKELLIDGIISNLSGTFDTVNTKVGEIAGEVGMTPAGWNGVDSTKRRPPSSLGRVRTSGRSVSALELLCGMGHLPQESRRDRFDPFLFQFKA